MRLHMLEDTKGLTCAEMPRFLDDDGKPTHDEEAAAIDPHSGDPVTNPARNIWVTETALANAINTSYFAESVATFSIVTGLALLLAGVGFLVLTLRLPWRGEGEESAAESWVAQLERSALAPLAWRARLELERQAIADRGLNGSDVAGSMSHETFQRSAGALRARSMAPRAPSAR
jgi:hypothetical protein